MDAVDLYPNDVLLLKDGREAVVETVEFYRESQKTYNFAVDDLHCYAVGNLAVLVHNGCGDDLIKAGYPKPSAAHQAAHIVPRGAFSNRSGLVQKAISLAQGKMDAYLGGMRNRAVNLFWATAGHAGTHTNEYFLTLGKVFKKVNSTEGVLDALDQMCSMINAGMF